MRDGAIVADRRAAAAADIDHRAVLDVAGAADAHRGALGADHAIGPGAAALARADPAEDAGGGIDVGRAVEQDFGAEGEGHGAGPAVAASIPAGLSRPRNARARSASAGVASNGRATSTSARTLCGSRRTRPTRHNRRGGQPMSRGSARPVDRFAWITPAQGAVPDRQAMPRAARFQLSRCHAHRGCDQPARGWCASVQPAGFW